MSERSLYSQNVEIRFQKRKSLCKISARKNTITRNIFRIDKKTSDFILRRDWTHFVGGSLELNLAKLELSKTFKVVSLHILRTLLAFRSMGVDSVTPSSLIIVIIMDEIRMGNGDDFTIHYFHSVRALTKDVFNEIQLIYNSKLKTSSLVLSSPFSKCKVQHVSLAIFCAASVDLLWSCHKWHFTTSFSWNRKLSFTASGGWWSPSSPSPQIKALSSHMAMRARSSITRAPQKLVLHLYS